VVKALDELPGDTVIDGEIVALDETGKPSFNLLQGFGAEGAGVVLYAFDLLMLLGEDARLWPLEERREQLHRIIQRLPSGAVRYSETFNVPVQELIRAVKEQRLEGIIAKRAGSRYRSGERWEDWLKWRANRRQEFVIGGYVPDGMSLDSILVGYYDQRDLIYAARSPRPPKGLRRVLLPHLQELQIPQCPFSNLPELSDGHWGARVSPPQKWLCAAGSILFLSLLPELSFWNGP